MTASPETQRHREEHDIFRRQALRLRDDLARQRQVLTVEVIDFVRDWLVGHILTTDKMLAPVADGQGLT